MSRPPPRAKVERNPHYRPFDGTAPSRGGGWYERWRGSDGRWVGNYTKAYREAAAGAKYRDNLRFAALLPRIRGQYSRDLGRLGDPIQPRTITALMVALIDQCAFRVGNEDSASTHHERRNATGSSTRARGPVDDGGNYGITTLRGQHLELRGEVATFSFYAKKGHPTRVEVELDGRMRELLVFLKRACAEDSDWLFRCAGTRLDDATVRRYLEPFGVIPHRFRTFAATRIAMGVLLEHADAPKGAREQVVTAAAERAQAQLHHESRTTTLESYIDPAVIRSFLAGRLADFARTRQRRLQTECAFAFLKQHAEASGAARPQVLTAMAKAVSSTRGVELPARFFDGWVDPELIKAYRQGRLADYDLEAA